VSFLKCLSDIQLLLIKDKRCLIFQMKFSDSGCLANIVLKHLKNMNMHVCKCFLVERVFSLSIDGGVASYRLASTHLLDASRSPYTPDNYNNRTPEEGANLQFFRSFEAYQKHFISSYEL